MSLRSFVNRVIVLVLLSTCVFVSGCKEEKDNDNTPVLPAGYQIIEGDSIIIIPDSAVAFAGTRTNPHNFDYNAYMLREFQIATNPSLNANPYQGDLSEWKSEVWPVRQAYLENAAGYTHNIMADSLAQYYYMIGKYINQFGYGWRDTYDWQNVDVNVGTFDHIWEQSGDNPATVAFDGNSPWFYQYRSMWIRVPR